MLPSRAQAQRHAHRMKKLTTLTPLYMNTSELTTKASVSQKPSKVWCAAVDMSQQLVDAP
jgi:hypothetical protein